MDNADSASAHAVGDPAAPSAAQPGGAAPGARIRRAWVWGLAGVALLILTLPFDAAIGKWFADVAVDGTCLRRAFKLLAHVLASWGGRQLKG